MSLPTDFKYSKEHTWISPDDGKIGITDFAQSELGEIVYVDLPALGVAFKLDAIFGSVEAVKTTSDLFMPVSGTVLAVNEKLKETPSLVNSDPFGEGWLIQIRLSDEKEMNGLLDASAYQAIIS